jgi:hypothetical protein
MYGDVAQSAGLIFLSLVMESGRSRRSDIRGQCMATEAQQIDLVLLEHPLIR